MRRINLKSSRFYYPSRFIFFDTETFPYVVAKEKEREYEKHVLRLGVAIYRDFKTNEREKIFFKEDWIFWRFVFSHLRKNDPLYVVAHNINFDLHVVNYEKVLKSNGFKIRRKHVKDHEIDMLYFHGRIFYLEVEKDGYVIRFLNSGNIFPGSVDEIGNALGYNKLEMPDWNAPDEVWFPYCERDVEIIEKAFENWLEFLKEEKLGSFAMTLAGQALRAFFARFCDVNIYHHDIPEITILERSAYHGGRTECFVLNEIPGPVYYVDVNSLYPFVMRNNPYPIKLVDYKINISPSELKKLLNAGYLLCADVHVNTNLPILPKKHENKLVAPIGCFRTQIFTPEIELAFEHGEILHVYAVSVYEGHMLFTSYVDYFYTKKQTSEGMQKFMYKLLLNSLYGKFAQRKPRWETVGEIDENAYQELPAYERIDTGEKIITVRRIWGLEQISTEEVQYDSYYAFTPIAGHVTAYAWKYMTKLLLRWWHDRNVYYMDTDSFFLSETAYRDLEKMNLIDKNELGKFKLEEVFDKVIIRAPKDYCCYKDNRIYEKIKGVGKGEPIGLNKYKVLVFPSPAGLLRLRKKGLNDGYFTIYTVKELKRVYEKGIPHQNIVYPLEIYE